MARNKTGILELDEMLRGGFMDKDAVMVAGSAGTGKTTLALEYLVNGATQFGEPGVYLTFEQLPDQIYRDAENFGWDLRKLEAENKLRVVCTSPDLLLDPEGEEQILGETIKELQPRRMVIDSLNHLEMYVPHGDLRKEACRILMYIKTRGISPIVIWEAQQGVDSYAVTQAGMSFLVDCLVTLKFVEIDSSMKKALVIMKMRGSDHDKRLREYEITAHGVRVAAPFSGYEGIITGSPHRSFTQEVAGAWDTAFTKRNISNNHRECQERRHSSNLHPLSVARSPTLISLNTTRRIGVIPVPIFVALIAIFDVILPTSVAASVAFNPLLVFAMLQTLFLFGTAVVVAYISLKSYLSGGSRTILLLGSGTLAWGFASMVAGWLLGPPGGPNIAVTISNSGALFASLFYIASAATTMRASSSRDSKRRKSKLLLAYGGAVGFLAALTAFAVLGATPAFFVPGVGSTVLRQVVVATGLFLFAATSILFMRLYIDSRSGILFWYSMALALTAIGLGAFYFGRTIGDPIAWTGRTATYLGGIYSLIAIWSAVRGSHGSPVGPQ